MTSRKIARNSYYGQPNEGTVGRAFQLLKLPKASELARIMDYVDCLWSRDPTNGQERISEARGSKLRFIVNGASPAKDSALASAGAELRFANGIALLGKFDGEFASRSNTYAGTSTLRVSW